MRTRDARGASAQLRRRRDRASRGCKRFASAGFRAGSASFSTSWQTVCKHRFSHQAFYVGIGKERLGRCEASRTKPLVVNDGLCHEVEKLARAALFAADATFDCCYPCQTFSTVAFGSPAQMFHVKHRTERNAGGWDPPLNRNRHDRSPPGSELSRADVGATATDRQNRAGAAEGVDFAGWGGLHGRAPGFGRSRGLGRWRICAAVKPVCDI